MAVISIEDPSKRKTGARFAPFALGFRPFFLLAGWSAVVLMAAWAYFFATGRPLATHYGYIGWHSHEMVFGYAAAVAAGFLLTAARNWTQVQTVNGTALASLAALWLTARILPFTPVPPWLLAAVDIAFLPLLGVALARPLVRARHHKSLMFVAVLVGMALANAVVHAGGLWGMEARGALYFAVDLIVLLIVIMGGRVIPFFTERAVDAKVATWTVMDRLSVFSVGLLAAVELVSPGGFWAAVTALFAAAFNGVRVAGWYTARIWRVPILWILHTGYLWLAAGLALKALAPLAGLGSPMLALHALTAGGIGAVTLGMMARVSLGHTGRTLQLPRGMGTAFVLLNFAALTRVAGPLLLPTPYAFWIGLSGAFWSVAFLIFAVAYTPILIRPRIDGMPG